MKLPGKLYEELVEALLEAFPTKDKLTQMLRYKLDEDLEKISTGENLRDIAFSIVREAEAKEGIMRLVQAARESNPDSSPLENFEKKAKQLSTKHVQDASLKKLLGWISEKIDEKKYFEAVYLCKLGFILASQTALESFLDFRENTSHSFYSEEDEVVRNERERLSNLEYLLKIQASGISVVDYKTFDKVTPDVIISFPCKPFIVRKEDGLSKENAVWAHDFLLSTLIKWQNNGLKPLVTERCRKSIMGS